MSNLSCYNFTTGEWEELKVSTKFTELTNTVTLTQDSSYVNIGITNFNPVEDVLYVFKNSTFQAKGTKYILNGGLLRIETIDGSMWKKDTIFNFVALKNVDKNALPSADGSLIQDGSITISKLATSIQSYINKIGTSTLKTTSQDLSNGVNEIVDKIGILNTQLAEIVQKQNSNLKYKGSTIYIPYDDNLDYNSIFSKLQNNNTKHIIIEPKIKVDTPTSTTFAKATTDTRVNEIISLAKTYNLNIVALSPICDIVSNGTRKFQPSNIDTWFTNLQSILIDYSNICKNQNIPHMIISREYSSMTGASNYTKWQTLTNSLKINNSQCKIVISTTYNEFTSTCAIFDLVDVIGLNYYPHITINGLNASNYELEKGFYVDLQGYSFYQPILKNYEKYKKPIWITELGCVPTADGLFHPESWANASLEERNRYDIQSKFFDISLNILTNMNIIEGIWIWNVTDGMSYLGHISESIVNKYFGGDN